MKAHVRLGACDEERAGQVERMQAGEVDVATIHHVDRPRSQLQKVERMHIVQLAAGNMDKAWDAALLP
jgi:hypothetical protein